MKQENTMNLGTHEVELSREIMIVSATDEKGKIIYVNNDFCNIAGYSKDELIGSQHNMVRNKFMPKSTFEDLWSTIKSENIWNGIVVNSTKDGGYYWVNATIFPSKNIDGTTRFVSLRVRPTKDEIEDAISLYKTLD